MSYADKVFIDMCRDIIENGTSTEGEKVRPVWEDGTPAYTVKKFGVVNRYDLSKEFPALTLRRTGAVPTSCFGSGRKNPIISTI
jgi:thymidylate synthase